MYRCLLIVFGFLELILHMTLSYFMRKIMWPALKSSSRFFMYGVCAFYLFIIVLEIFFIMVRSNNSINLLRILDFVYLLSAYADATTFFVSDLDSVKAIFETFDNFSLFSGMKINLSKCELAGIGVKRSVLTALLGVNNVSLLTNCIRILGVKVILTSFLTYEYFYLI